MWVLPFWWSLTNFPTGARIDAEDGVLIWSPMEDGAFTFTVMLENNWGSTEQTFSYMVVSEEEETEPSQELERKNHQTRIVVILIQKLTNM